MGLFDFLRNKQINNTTATQASINRFNFLYGLTHDGNRDLYAVFGFPQNPVFQDFYNLYKRNPIANRIVNVYPDYCWALMPDILDDDDIENETEFEKSVNELFKRLNVLSYLKKLDVLQRIGRYGVMVVGGDINLSQPLNKSDVAYLNSYHEGAVGILNKYEDTTKFNYMMPKTYSIATGDELTGKRTINVDATHIIHVAEGALDNDIVGQSCLEPIINDLLNLEKVVGSGAESFYLNARGGLHVDSKESVNGEDAVNLTATFNNYIHKLTRILKTTNMTVTPINYEVHDPKEQYDVSIANISGCSGIPSAILTGHENGVRASGNDLGNFLSNISNRQTGFCEPFMLRPIINHFINRGALPEPINGEYKINWKPLQSQNELEKADTALKKMQAVNAYASGLARDVITPQQAGDMIGFDYREDLLDVGLDDEAQDMNNLNEDLPVE